MSVLARILLALAFALPVMASRWHGPGRGVQHVGGLRASGYAQPALVQTRTAAAAATQHMHQRSDKRLERMRLDTALSIPSPAPQRIAGGNFTRLLLSKRQNGSGGTWTQAPAPGPGPDDDEEEEEKRMKEEVRKEVKEEVKEEVKKEVKKEVEKEVEEEVEEEKEKEEQERMSRLGEKVLEEKWAVFKWSLVGLVCFIVLLGTLCYFSPSFSVEDELEGDGHGSERRLPQGVGTAVIATVLFLPVGVMARIFDWGPAWTFWINILAVVPEAYILGVATEELALHFGDAIGALLNASFGNATELLFVYLTLRDGLVDATSGSLVGSILSNHLVLLGVSFLVGGIIVKPPHKLRLSIEARFDATSALNQAQQLLLASFAVALPAIFAQLQHVTPKHVVTLSMAFSLFLLLSYVALVFYQLFHSAPLHTGAQSILSIRAAVLMLAVATAVIAISSECMIHALDEWAMEIGLSQTFVGVVILPIAGDLSHMSAVYMAMKDKMDLSINIALASAIQVALVVVPASIYMAYAMERPLSLGFSELHGVNLIMSAVITFAVLTDGRSNWLRGMALLTTFTLIALVLFFMPDPRMPYGFL
eukprot:gnl/TRDRNA2_/TRDRNA2_138544_c1_seq1.p1 gnl/TRDRNA2_/TRDRNA2_138544_c1~~gnl/TRDRNA2_/TRDRNA2_138544_c1_seq1.p1  ORF type:complete len:592 (+),score=133.66 gnl/TRDRNA2_/TRDRNA2_138544_c1_seq1:134-1909(+)